MFYDLLTSNKYPNILNSKWDHINFPTRKLIIYSYSKIATWLAEKYFRTTFRKIFFRNRGKKFKRTLCNFDAILKEKMNFCPLNLLSNLLGKHKYLI